MPRYFFNIYDGRDIHDEVGVELQTVKAVRKHMINVAMNLMEEIDEHSHPWQMEALDEKGKIIGTMEFGIKPSTGETN